MAVDKLLDAQFASITIASKSRSELLVLNPSQAQLPPVISDSMPGLRKLYDCFPAANESPEDRRDGLARTAIVPIEYVREHQLSNLALEDNQVYVSRWEGSHSATDRALIEAAAWLLRRQWNGQCAWGTSQSRFRRWAGMLAQRVAPHLVPRAIDDFPRQPSDVPSENDLVRSVLPPQIASLALADVDLEAARARHAAAKADVTRLEMYQRRVTACHEELQRLDRDCRAAKSSSGAVACALASAEKAAAACRRAGKRLDAQRSLCEDAAKQAAHASSKRANQSDVPPGTVTAAEDAACDECFDAVRSATKAAHDAIEKAASASHDAVVQERAAGRDVEALEKALPSAVDDAAEVVSTYAIERVAVDQALRVALYPQFPQSVIARAVVYVQSLFRAGPIGTGGNGVTRSAHARDASIPEPLKVADAAAILRTLPRRLLGHPHRAARYLRYAHFLYRVVPSVVFGVLVRVLAWVPSPRESLRQRRFVSSRGFDAERSHHVAEVARLALTNPKSSGMFSSRESAPVLVAVQPKRLQRMKWMRIVLMLAAGPFAVFTLAILYLYRTRVVTLLRRGSGAGAYRLREQGASSHRFLWTDLRRPFGVFHMLTWYRIAGWFNWWLCATCTVYWLMLLSPQSRAEVTVEPIETSVAEVGELMDSLLDLVEEKQQIVKEWSKAKRAWRECARGESAADPMEADAIAARVAVHQSPDDAFIGKGWAVLRRLEYLVEHHEKLKTLTTRAEDPHHLRSRFAKLLHHHKDIAGRSSVPDSALTTTSAVVIMAELLCDVALFRGCFITALDAGTIAERLAKQKTKQPTRGSWALGMDFSPQRDNPEHAVLLQTLEFAAPQGCSPVIHDDAWFSKHVLKDRFRANDLLVKPCNSKRFAALFPGTELWGLQTWFAPWGDQQASFDDVKPLSVTVATTCKADRFEKPFDSSFALPWFDPVLRALRSRSIADVVQRVTDVFVPNQPHDPHVVQTSSNERAHGYLKVALDCCEAAYGAPSLPSPIASPGDQNAIATRTLRAKALELFCIFGSDQRCLDESIEVVNPAVCTTERPTAIEIVYSSSDFWCQWSVLANGVRSGWRAFVERPSPTRLLEAVFIGWAALNQRPSPTVLLRDDNINASDMPWHERWNRKITKAYYQWCGSVTPAPTDPQSFIRDHYQSPRAVIVVGQPTRRDVAALGHNENGTDKQSVPVFISFLGTYYPPAGKDGGSWSFLKQWVGTNACGTPVCINHLTEAVSTKLDWVKKRPASNPSGKLSLGMPDDACAHAGYLHMYMHMAPTIVATLDDIREKHGNNVQLDVHVCGHSLGGGLAQLCAAHLSAPFKCDVPGASHMHRRVVNLHTAGSPPVFNPAALRELHKRRNLIHRRFARSLDFVTYASDARKRVPVIRRGHHFGHAVPLTIPVEPAAAAALVVYGAGGHSSHKYAETIEKDIVPIHFDGLAKTKSQCLVAVESQSLFDVAADKAARLAIMFGTLPLFVPFAVATGVTARLPKFPSFGSMASTEATQ